MSQNKNNKTFPVVGVGASAGGLEALEGFFANMPQDSGIAFVVIQHLDPKHKSLLSSILQKDTKMTVSQIEDGTEIEPNHVYIIPSNNDVIIKDHTFLLMKPTKTKGLHLPVDRFFRSLADNFKENAIGVILSGTGTDGTLGIKAIEAASGMTMVQDEQQAKYVGMPKSAIGTGAIDFILPVEEMGKTIIQYINRPYQEKERKRKIDERFFEINFKKIFLLIQKKTGHDFSDYKRMTIFRRIQRRMALHQIDKIETYVAYLQENSGEVEALFKDLLIRVTNFFRDPEAFDLLKQTAILPLLKNKSAETPLRVWVPGCATGEEVYSIAILFAEAMDELRKYFPVQIFASDIDAEAVEIARTASYPQNISVDISLERLNRFFVKDEETYRVKKELREMVVFAVQNIIKDPPFSRLDMVSCRNLLIYMKSQLQKEIIPLFHYTLNKDGILFLGSSESIGEFNNLFEIVDSKFRIFRRKECFNDTIYSYSGTFFSSKAYTQREKEKNTSYPKVDVARLAERLVLDNHAPPTVLIDEKYEIHYFIGNTNKYVANPKGERTFNILQMARWGLKTKLKKGLQKAVSTQKPVVYKNIRVKQNGDFCLLDLHIEPITKPDGINHLLLVIFYEKPYLDEVLDEKGTESREASSKAERLEEELETTRTDLQITIEELETSNEEMQSVNEELQSTNEELETSREELHATNEELETVNAELQRKVEELTHAKDDADNFFASTEIATIFLDNDLLVKRFTPQMKVLFNLRKSDIDRPISDITSNFSYEKLAQDTKKVLDTLNTKELEITDKYGKQYSVRIKPYRTLENVIKGVVITFVNITEIKDAQLFAESIVETVREPLIILDDTLKVKSANKAFYTMFNVSPAETEGSLIYNLGNNQWDIPKLRELLEKIIPEDSHFEDYLIEYDFPKIGYRKMLLNARRIDQKGTQQALILLAMEDVTE